MIEYSKRNMRSWSIMGINPSVWSVGFNEVIETDSNVSVITADLSRFSGLERMASKYPQVFYNVGIAEQNMVGVAAGMAMEGQTTFITTYAPFVTFRCADQVRHLMGNMKLNIKAIGSSAGLTSGWSGSALTAINDIAFMRSIPNMTIVSPADCTEAIKTMIAISKLRGPVYMRLCGTTAIPAVYGADYEFEIGKAIELVHGAEIAIIATGTCIVPEAIRASEIIKEKINVQPTVVNMHTIKPIDANCITELSYKYDIIVTVEEHSIIGGLGSAVAERISELNRRPRHISIGINDTVLKMGSRNYMLDQAGLNAKAIAEEIISKYRSNM